MEIYKDLSSPATQELFRKIVGERVATVSSTKPNNLEFGQMLPDYLSVPSMFEDIGGFVKDTGLEAVEKSIALGGGMFADPGLRNLADSNTSTACISCGPR